MSMITLSNTPIHMHTHLSIQVDIAFKGAIMKRFNANFPEEILEKIDQFVQQTDDNRSNFLIKASESYIKSQDMSGYLSKIDSCLSRAVPIIEKYEHNEESVTKSDDDINLLFDIVLEFEITRALLLRDTPKNSTAYYDYIHVINKYHRPSGVTMEGSSILYNHNIRDYKVLSNYLRTIVDLIFDKKLLK